MFHDFKYDVNVKQPPVAVVIVHYRNVLSVRRNKIRVGDCDKSHQPPPAPCVSAMLTIMLPKPSKRQGMNFDDKVYEYLYAFLRSLI